MSFLDGIQGISSVAESNCGDGKLNKEELYIRMFSQASGFQNPNDMHPISPCMQISLCEKSGAGLESSIEPATMTKQQRQTSSTNNDLCCV